MGVGIQYVTLHVSLGTFRSVKTTEVEKHVMHSEWFSISEGTAKRLNEVKSRGGRVIAVGTTTARVLESVCDQGKVGGKNGETNIFIYPPYRFKFVDGLITNFHLPKSTLLMLVSAFVSRPNANEEFVDFKTSFLGKAYDHAIERKYRFFSFGDGMIII
jgi:S-adenosylmethionine:tRNA ribosyltransferase-isomerase